MTYEEEITRLRKEINRINNEILDKIAERADVAREIAKLKRRNGKPIVDAAREHAVLFEARKQAAEQGLNPDLVERIYQTIIDLCVKVEEKP